MALPVRSNSGKGRHHHLPDHVSHGAHAGLQGKAPGSDNRSATTIAHDTGMTVLKASSTATITATTTRDLNYVTSTTASASDAKSSIGQNESPDTRVLHSRPAYARSQKPVHQNELELRASALEMREAMKSEQWLTQWKKICSKQNRVRLELPSKDTLPLCNTLAEKESLKLLNSGLLDLRSDPGVRQTKECFHEHLFFMRRVVENCNALKEEGQADVTLGIELPLPLFRPNSIMHPFEDSTVRIQLKTFVETIQTDKMIVSLGLSGIRSEWFGLDILANYFASLATNSRLEVLDLTSADLENEDACALAEALEKNRSIKSIKLNGCKIPKEGMEALERILKKRGALEEAL